MDDRSVRHRRREIEGESEGIHAEAERRGHHSEVRHASGEHRLRPGEWGVRYSLCLRIPMDVGQIHGSRSRGTRVSGAAGVLAVVTDIQAALLSLAMTTPSVLVVDTESSPALL